VRRAAVALLSAAFLSCAAPEPLVPAAVRVDLIRTASPLLDWDQSAPPPIHLLLDVTSSMQAASTEGVTYLQAARHAAERFLYSVSSDADVTLHLLGTAIGSACTPAVPVKAPPGTSPGEGLAPIARALPSRSEGSLANAIEAIARRIRSEEQGWAGVRLVAISDLDDSCARGDLCDAAAALVSAGAALDLVVIGEAPVPACLGQVGGDGEPPLFAATETAPIRATFRVIGEGQGEEVPLPVVGVMGGAAVKVAPGRIRIGIDLDPPVEMGPVDLAPNASLRVRILEAPAGESQRWQVFVDGTNVRSGEGSVR
jgi:hypothetical protein